MADNLRSVKQSKPPQQAASNALSKSFQFLKEWGGLITLLIAVLYTFPFQVLDRYANWTGEGVKKSKDILVTSSQLYAEKVKTLSAMNPQRPDELFAKDFIAKMYDMRIYNLIVPNIETIREAAGRLHTSEIYAFGSLLALNGRVDESLVFYDLAIAREKDAGMLAAIYRELGNALATPGPSQDPDRSHAAYLAALTYLADSSYPAAKVGYMNTLGELIVVEYNLRMFDCANFHRAYYYSLLGWMQADAALTAAVSPGRQMFEAMTAPIPFTPVRSSACKDHSKVLPGGPEPL